MKLPRELQTDRLILRPHTPEDFEGFFSAITNEQATRFLKFSPGERTREGSRAFYDEILATMETEKPIFGLAVVEKGSRVYTGFFGLSSLKDEPGAEVYYVFLPGFWSKGYATEAATAIFEYAFSVLNLSKLITYIPSASKGSVRVAEKLGMKFERSETHNEFLSEVARYYIRKEDFFAE